MADVSREKTMGRSASRWLARVRIIVHGIMLIIDHSIIDEIIIE